MGTAMIPYVTKDFGIMRADYYDELIQKKKKWFEDNKEQLRRDAYTKSQMVGQFKEDLLKYSAGRLDSTDTNFIARSLLHVLSKVKTITHPGDILEQAFIINREGGAGLTSLSYLEVDYTGQFKPLGSSAKDLSPVGSTLREYPSPVETYAATMVWNQRDLERSRKANVNLMGRKQEAIAIAAKKTKNSTAWTGNTTLGLPGFFSYPLNPVTIAGSWATATPEVIMKDVQLVANEAVKDTEDFTADTVVMDTTSHTFMTNKLTYGNDSIASWLLNKTPIRALLKTSYLNSVTSAVNSLSANRVITAYPNSDAILEFMMPRDLQFMPVDRNGLWYNVDVLLDLGGMFMYKYGTGGPVTFAIPS